MHVVTGATHYYQGQPDLLAEAAATTIGWLEARNLLD